jgi:hypothetical protein
MEEVMETELANATPARTAPAYENWAQEVSLADCFVLLLKFAVASVPFWIALLFASPFILDAVRGFYAGFNGGAR